MALRIARTMEAPKVGAKPKQSLIRCDSSRAGGPAGRGTRTVSQQGAWPQPLSGTGPHLRGRRSDRTGCKPAGGRAMEYTATPGRGKGLGGDRRTSGKGGAARASDRLVGTRPEVDEPDRAEGGAAYTGAGETGSPRGHVPSNGDGGTGAPYPRVVDQVLRRCLVPSSPAPSADLGGTVMARQSMSHMRDRGGQCVRSLGGNDDMLLVLRSGQPLPMSEAASADRAPHSATGAGDCHEADANASESEASGGDERGTGDLDGPFGMEAPNGGGAPGGQFRDDLREPAALSEPQATGLSRGHKDFETPDESAQQADGGPAQECPAVPMRCPILPADAGECLCVSGCHDGELQQSDVQEGDRQAGSSHPAAGARSVGGPGDGVDEDQRMLRNGASDVSGARLLKAEAASQTVAGGPQAADDYAETGRDTPTHGIVEIDVPRKSLGMPLGGISTLAATRDAPMHVQTTIAQPQVPAAIDELYDKIVMLPGRVRANRQGGPQALTEEKTGPATGGHTTGREPERSTGCGIGHEPERVRRLYGFTLTILSMSSRDLNFVYKIV